MSHIIIVCFVLEMVAIIAVWIGVLINRSSITGVQWRMKALEEAFCDEYPQLRARFYEKLLQRIPEDE